MAIIVLEEVGLLKGFFSYSYYHKLASSAMFKLN